MPGLIDALIARKRRPAMVDGDVTRDDPLAALFAAYDEERRGIHLAGRFMSDLDRDPSDGTIRPLNEMLRKGLRRRGLALIEYSFATGLDYDETRLAPEDRDTIRTALRSHRLLDIPRDRDELVRVIHGVSRMSRVPSGQLRWSDGEPMKFAFFFQFGEHIVPAQTDESAATPDQLAVVELAILTVQSLALRASGNCLIFSAEEGRIERRLASVLHTVRLPQPDEPSKTLFIRKVLAHYPEAKVEDGLDPEEIARLTGNTPNAPIEALLRASRVNGLPIRRQDLARERAKAVVELSEGTLKVLDTAAVEHIELVGRNVEVPMRELKIVAGALRRGDSATPRAIVAVGPPGGGKSLGAQIVACNAGTAAFDALSPKDKYVGETERKAEKQERLSREWAPNTIRHEEITESLPLQRQDHNGDNGATNAWIAILLTSLADETLRGRSLVIGTTNCPWRIGEAQRDRLEFLPFLFPLREDFPAILAAIGRNFRRGIELDPSDSSIRQAADIFFQKGAGPRAMVQALNRTLVRRGKLSPQDAVFAARDYCGASDLDSVIYADLWAVFVTSSMSYLPWGDDPKSYPFPDHLREIVDRESGEIDRRALRAAIEGLKPHANV